MPRKLKSIPPGEPPLPLDYMLAVMGDEEAPPARRDEMARMAAPYLHAKAEERLKRGRKAVATVALTEEGAQADDPDADPIIRTARATLKRKLSRLAAESGDPPPD